MASATERLGAQSRSRPSVPSQSAPLPIPFFQAASSVRLVIVIKPRPPGSAIVIRSPCRSSSRTNRRCSWPAWVAPTLSMVRMRSEIGSNGSRSPSLVARYKDRPAASWVLVAGPVERDEHEATPRAPRKGDELGFEARGLMHIDAVPLARQNGSRRGAAASVGSERAAGAASAAGAALRGGEVDGLAAEAGLAASRAEHEGDAVSLGRAAHELAGGRPGAVGLCAGDCCAPSGDSRCWSSRCRRRRSRRPKRPARRFHRRLDQGHGARPL